MSRARSAALALAAGLLLGGCGKPGPPDPVEVAGRVEYGAGRPVTTAVVTFHPAGESNKRGALLSAVVKEGRFSGKCLPGPYKVTITPLAGGTVNPAGGSSPSGGTTPGKGGGSIPEHFRSVTSTPWSVDVPPGGKKDIRLTLR